MNGRTPEEISRPPGSTEGKLARETDDRPIVRDDEHNPVVRKLDLVEYVQPVKNASAELQSGLKQARWEGRIGMTLVGVASYLGQSKIDKLAATIVDAQLYGITAVFRAITRHIS